MRRRADAVAAVAPADLPCACATARRISRLLTQAYDRHLREAGVESTQFALLSVLASAGPCTQAAIGQRFGFDKSTLSRNLKVLRERGWIADAQAVSVRERPCALTAEGRRRLKAATPGWRKAQAALRASLGDAGWEAMWTTFRQVAAAGHPRLTRRRGGGARAGSSS